MTQAGRMFDNNNSLVKPRGQQDMANSHTNYKK